jgi:hypothetical protein
LKFRVEREREIDDLADIRLIVDVEYACFSHPFAADRPIEIVADVSAARVDLAITTGMMS